MEGDEARRRRAARGEDLARLDRDRGRDRDRRDEKKHRRRRDRSEDSDERRARKEEKRRRRDRERSRSPSRERRRARDDRDDHRDHRDDHRDDRDAGRRRRRTRSRSRSRTRSRSPSPPDLDDRRRSSASGGLPRGEPSRSSRRRHPSPDAHDPRARSPDRDRPSPAMLALQQQQLAAARDAIRRREEAAAAAARARATERAANQPLSPGETANVALSNTPSAVEAKKRREVYVGNLAVGVVTGAHVRELFDAVLARLFPDSAASGGAPVLNVNVDASGMFCFVELRSEALANAATHLDKTDLAGRPMNVGRPRGYAEPTRGHVPSFEPCRFDTPYDAAGDERKWR